MVALRHAALHAQEQRMIWRQVFIESTECASQLTKVKRTFNAKNKSIQTEMSMPSYCGFFTGVAGLDAAAGGLVSSVADFMVSSLGQPLSRYGLPCFSIFGWSGPAVSPYWS